MKKTVSIQFEVQLWSKNRKIYLKDISLELYTVYKILDILYTVIVLYSRCDISDVLSQNADAMIV